MEEKHPVVYILASKKYGTSYVGVTSNLQKRIWQHKNNLVDGFSKKYSVHILVWYEMHKTMESAISQEKKIKKWRRSWKIKLIRDMNPDWNDLYDEVIQ